MNFCDNSLYLYNCTYLLLAKYLIRVFIYFLVGRVWYGKYYFLLNTVIMVFFLIRLTADWFLTIQFM